MSNLELIAVIVVFLTVALSTVSILGFAVLICKTNFSKRQFVLMSKLLDVFAKILKIRV